MKYLLLSTLLLPLATIASAQEVHKKKTTKIQTNYDYLFYNAERKLYFSSIPKITIDKTITNFLPDGRQVDENGNYEPPLTFLETDTTVILDIPKEKFMQIQYADSILKFTEDIHYFYFQDSIVVVIL